MRFLYAGAFGGSVAALGAVRRSAVELDQRGVVDVAAESDLHLLGSTNESVADRQRPSRHGDAKRPLRAMEIIAESLIAFCALEVRLWRYPMMWGLLRTLGFRSRSHCITFHTNNYDCPAWCFTTATPGPRRSTPILAVPFSPDLGGWKSGNEITAVNRQNRPGDEVSERRT